jgi:hypothetical protein
MPEATLTIQLEGASEDQGHVRLGEFIDELKAVSAALRHTERILTGGENTVYYRIIDLKHSSPSTVRIQSVAQKPLHAAMPRKIFRRFSTSVRMIRKGRLPVDFDAEAIEAFKNLTDPLKKHLARVKFIEEDRKEAVVDQKYEQALNKIIGFDQKERGSILGKLDALNVHLSNNQFFVYPTIGPTRLTCRFQNPLRNKVLAAAGQYVRVDGWAIYKSNAKFPHAMQVTDLEVLAEGQASKLSDIRGIAPDATNGEKSEDFVRKIRDAW